MAVVPKTPFLHIFNHYVFDVPEFQRPFRWEVEEVTSFVETIVTASRERPRAPLLLGCMFFADHRTPGLVEYPPPVAIIDGLQRSTTIMLMYAVMRQLLRFTVPASVEEIAAVKRTTHCLQILLKSQSQDARPARLLLRRSSHGADYWLHLLQEDERGLLRRDSDGKPMVEGIPQQYAKNEVCHRLYEAAKIILIELLKLPNWNSTGLPALYEFMSNQCQLIVILDPSLKDSLETYMNINRTGRKLNIFDEIKAMLLQNCDASLRSSYADQWDDAFAKIGDDRTDDFFSWMQCMYFAQSEGEWPERGGSMATATDFDKACQLFPPLNSADFFKEWLGKCSVAFANIKELISGVSVATGTQYRRVSELPHQVYAQARLKLLACHPWEQWYAIAIAYEVEDKTDAPDQTKRKEFYEGLEMLWGAMLVGRYNVVAGKEDESDRKIRTSDIITTAMKIIMRIKKRATRGDTSGEGNLIKYLAEERNKYAFNFPHNLNMNWWEKDQRTCKYLLLSYNRWLLMDQTNRNDTSLMDWAVDVAFDPVNMTIEHICPRTDNVKKTDWDSSPWTRAHRRKCVHILGNWTLLSGSHNSMSKNDSYKVKAEIYRHSGFKITADVVHKCNPDNGWLPFTVAHRHREMSKNLLKLALLINV
ncbi:hypothetical protein DFS34DRAFT_202393 [Phlyctochytrium arcticum]|nr:hypothetical protein DFS34DRAFT_202393 [Phlyctochytrium arcticum]